MRVYQKKGTGYRYGLVCLIVWLATVSFYQTHKKIPENLNYLGDEYKVSEAEVEFLYDLTYKDSAGELQSDQSIFDVMSDYIEHAEKYILIDMFLFNSYTIQDGRFHRNLSDELSERLINKRLRNPGIAIDFITDPVNTVYGGSSSPELEALRAAGINVIVSNLEKLRDSNFLYSAVWRTFFQWFGNSSQHGLVKHPFSNSAGKVTLRSYLRMANFKANHRKVFVADTNGEMVVLISSANPHGGSSAHSNVALLVRGEIWRSVYRTEMAIAKLSGGTLSPIEMAAGKTRLPTGVALRIISENQIKKALIKEISVTESSDEMRLAQFYLSDRDILEALLAAAARGVDTKIILDRNKDAFGYEKNGIPNRPVASELVEKSNGAIKLRWYETHGEQFHSKLFISLRDKRMTAIMGSANLTRRNLDNYNLELDIKVTAANESRITKQIVSYFDKMWNNNGGVYTVDFARYQEGSFFKTIVYRVQEGLGLATF